MEFPDGKLEFSLTKICILCPHYFFFERTKVLPVICDYNSKDLNLKYCSSPVMFLLMTMLMAYRKNVDYMYFKETIGSLGLGIK